MAILAGRAAVEIKFGHIDVGASSDLERALAIVQRAVREYASSGFRFYSPDSRRCLASERKEYDVVEESDSVLAELYGEVKALLCKNWHKVERLAAALVERGTLLYDEAEELFGIDG